MKLTIKDLETILNRGNESPVEIMPNGEVHVFEAGEPRPQGPVRIVTLQQALGDNY